MPGFPAIGTHLAPSMQLEDMAGRRQRVDTILVAAAGVLVVDAVVLEAAAVEAFAVVPPVAASAATFYPQYQKLELRLLFDASSSLSGS